jgi:hypothetical protein
LKSFYDILNHYFEITHKVLNIDFEKNIKSKELMKSSKTEETIKLFENKTKTSQLEPKLFPKSLELKEDYENDFNSGFLNNNRYKSEFKELELIGVGSFGKVYKVLNCLD